MTTTETPKELISQGAEALVYRTTYLRPSIPALLKLCPPKPCRHPTLDARLTQHRCLTEARLLMIRARSVDVGVPVPAVYFIDAPRGELYMEWVCGHSVRQVLDGLLARVGGDVAVARMMVRLGQLVGMLHAADIVHGDLTTSNVMVRRHGGLSAGETMAGRRQEPEREREQQQEDLVLIDLGLGSISTADEDKAVDLYVLERAFASTHLKAERLFGDVLEAYARSHAGGSKPVLRRLRDVRMRGRKRSMIR